MKRNSTCNNTIVIEGVPNVEIEYFTNLGSIIDKSWGTEKDVKSRKLRYLSNLTKKQQQQQQHMGIKEHQNKNQT